MSTPPTTLLKPGQPDPKMDPQFHSTSLPGAVTFGISQVAPPSNEYVRTDDQLLVEAFSIFGQTNQVNVIVRLLLATPELAGQPDSQSASAAPAPKLPYTQAVKFFNASLITQSGIGSTAQIQLTEGYLLSVGATALGGAMRGRCFVRGSILRALGGGTTARIPLFADYISGLGSVGWPNGRVISSDEGPGFLQAVNIANPAAGSDWLISVPFSDRWRPVSFTGTFAAAIAVANRQVQIIVDDGANTYWIDDASANIPASTVDQITATTTNVPTGVVTTIQNVVLPPNLVMPSGHRIRSSTIGIQGADQWSNLWWLFEKWLDVV